VGADLAATAFREHLGAGAWDRDLRRKAVAARSAPTDVAARGSPTTGHL